MEGLSVKGGCVEEMKKGEKKLRYQIRLREGSKAVRQSQMPDWSNQRAATGCLQVSLVHVVELT